MCAFLIKPEEDAAVADVKVAEEDAAGLNEEKPEEDSLYAVVCFCRY